jgi:voltage-gated potassium channel Kch
MPDAGSIGPARARLGSGRLYLRGGALIGVFVAGFVGLAAGVELSERDLSEVSLWAKAYYTLGLFVVGGLDLGTPQGGPPIARAMVWTAYFMAPLITASAVVEMALRILNPLALRARRLRNHVIIGGAGRLALLYVKRLRELEPNVTIVVVERDANNARIAELQGAHRAVVIVGDITSDEVFEAAGLARARRVMLLTGDDFANLDAASRILARTPELRGRVVAHVADLAFKARLGRFAASPAPEQRGDGFETFNSLEAAAVDLVKHRLLAHFEATPHLDLVILAGFGRFGQTLLDQLQTHARGTFSAVVILDLDASLNVASFAEHPGFVDGYERRIIDGHVNHPAVWREIDEVVAADVGDPVIVVGTGDDGLNLHTALELRRRYPGAYVIVRSFGESPFTNEVTAAAGVLPFRLAELISHAMPRAWFE